VKQPRIPNQARSRSKRAPKRQAAMLKGQKARDIIGMDAAGKDLNDKETQLIVGSHIVYRLAVAGRIKMKSKTENSSSVGHT
jgi:hypothetical protein